MVDLSIVVPCYNEAGNLPRLFRAFAEVMPDDLAIEVVFVNNGSTDRSADLFPELLAAYPFATGVTITVNQGYGHGILTGLRAARGTTVGWTHADLQTDPKDVVEGCRRYLRELRAGAVMVKGRRIARPLFDRLFTAGMSLIATVALNQQFRDINAQPKLIPRRLLDEIGDPPLDFSFDLYCLWLASTKGLTIVEFPVRFGMRAAGEAKGGGSLRTKYKLTVRTLAFIWALRKRIRAEGR
jgi:glycosyltransferase involved in cell wall biosynthesis